MFIVGLVIAVIAIIVAFVLWIAFDSTVGAIVSIIVGGLFGGLFWFLSSFYVQDPGQANVLRAWDGTLVGTETAEGWHWKAPWVDTITFDVRNQRLVYTGGSSDGDNSGGSSDGPQITVQDGEGVSSNVDVAIRYSIDPAMVEDIYREYRDEASLVSKLIANDIRSMVRDAANKFDTLELLANRSEYAAAITSALEERWADDGILVDDVALQEIRPPESVVARYAEAQEAQIAVATETAKLESTKVSAQQKVVQAQAEADANAILNASLSPNILQQRYLDTLAKLAAEGNLVITDGTGTQVLVQR
jgi:regulator of protease activity HflC (stomatin/prohibitin superfamily)